MYTWSTAVQVHAVFTIISLGLLALAATQGASLVRMWWSWSCIAFAIVAAILVGAAQGLFMRYVLGVSLSYFAGVLRPMALYGPWTTAGAPEDTRARSSCFGRRGVCVCVCGWGRVHGAGVVRPL